MAEDTAPVVEPGRAAGKTHAAEVLDGRPVMVVTGRGRAFFARHSEGQLEPLFEGEAVRLTARTELYPCSPLLERALARRSCSTGGEDGPAG